MTSNEIFSADSNIVETNSKYAYEIKSQQYPEYNGRYIILLVAYIDITFQTCYCRAKITDGKTIPTTKEELERLEYVKSSLHFLEEAEYISEKKLNIIPDEYGYVYEYMFTILQGKKFLNQLFKLPDDWNIEYPLNEYMTPMTRGAFTSFPNLLTDDIICHYIWCNLKQGNDFTKEGHQHALEQLKVRRKEHKNYKRFSKIESDYAEKYGTDSKEYNDKMEELMQEAFNEYERTMQEK